MIDSKKTAVRVTPQQNTGAGSKVRTQFNKLIKQLEDERKRLSGWHEAIPRARERADREMRPLVEQYHQSMRNLALLFDDAWENKKVTNKESDALSTLIVDICEQVFDFANDPAMDDLYAKHTGLEVDFDDLENDPDFQAFKEVFGVDMDALFGEAGAHDDDGNASSERLGGANAETTPNPRKVTAKETRQAAEETRLKQSVRHIFRKLASVLHPDRETDPAERDRKNALMQRANVAYAADDLLGLLELQFEIAQVSEASLDAQGEEQIKQYNKLLSKQLKEVRAEIAGLEYHYAYEMNISSRVRITPAALEHGLTAEVEGMKTKLGYMERDLAKFQDLKELKAFLKSYARMAASEFYDGRYY